MKRFGIVLIALLVALVFVGVAGAQDVPVEDVPFALSTTEIVLIVSLALAFVLIGVFGGYLVRQGKLLADSLPPWAQDIYARNYDLVESAYERLDRYLEVQVEATETEFDDDLQELVDVRVRAVLAELKPPSAQG